MSPTNYTITEQGRMEIMKFILNFHRYSTPAIVKDTIYYWEGLVEADLLRGGAGIIELPPHLSSRNCDELFTISEQGYHRQKIGDNAALVKRLQQKMVLLRSGIQTVGMTSGEIEAAYLALEAKINGGQDGRA